MNNSNILVVEDDAAIRSLITTALETENYKYHVDVYKRQVQGKRRGSGGYVDTEFTLSIGIKK